MTIVRPWKRASQGSASTSAAAFAAELPSRETGLVGDRGDGHVLYAEFSWTYATVRSVVRIVALGRPGLQVERDRDVRPGEVDELARLAGGAVAADHHAVDRRRRG